MRPGSKSSRGARICGGHGSVQIQTLNLKEDVFAVGYVVRDGLVQTDFQFSDADNSLLFREDFADKGSMCSGIPSRTNCYYRGCNVKIMSKLLGHADVTVTYNIYIHLFGDALEEMRSVIG